MGNPDQPKVSFAVFSAFQFYVSKHVREYAGASTGFGYFLTAFAAAALLFQLGWWVYYGVTRGWLSAGKLAAVGADILRVRSLSTGNAPHGIPHAARGLGRGGPRPAGLHQFGGPGRAAVDRPFHAPSALSTVCIPTEVPNHCMQLTNAPGLFRPLRDIDRAFAADATALASHAGRSLERDATSVACRTV